MNDAIPSQIVLYGQSLGRKREGSVSLTMFVVKSPCQELYGAGFELGDV